MQHASASASASSHEEGSMKTTIFKTIETSDCDDDNFFECEQSASAASSTHEEDSIKSSTVNTIETSGCAADLFYECDDGASKHSFDISPASSSRFFKQENKSSAKTAQRNVQSKLQKTPHAAACTSDQVQKRVERDAINSLLGIGKD